MNAQDYADWLSQAITAGRLNYRTFRAERAVVGLSSEARGYASFDIPDPPGKPAHVRTACYEVDTSRTKPRHTLVVHRRDGTTERHPAPV